MDRVVFVVRISTKDYYFLLDRDSELSMERETASGGVGLEQ